MSAKCLRIEFVLAYCMEVGTGARALRRDIISTDFECLSTANMGMSIWICELNVHVTNLDVERLPDITKEL